MPPILNIFCYSFILIFAKMQSVCDIIACLRFLCHHLIVLESNMASNDHEYAAQLRQRLRGISRIGSFNFFFV